MDCELWGKKKKKKNQGWFQGLSLCIKVNNNIVTQKGETRERSLGVQVSCIGYVNWIYWFYNAC